MGFGSFGASMSTAGAMSALSSARSSNRAADQLRRSRNTNTHTKQNHPVTRELEDAIKYREGMHPKDNMHYDKSELWKDWEDIQNTMPGSQTLKALQYARLSDMYGIMAAEICKIDRPVMPSNTDEWSRNMAESLMKEEPKEVRLPWWKRLLKSIFG